MTVCTAMSSKAVAALQLRRCIAPGHAHQRTSRDLRQWPYWTSSRGWRSCGSCCGPGLRDSLRRPLRRLLALQLVDVCIVPLLPFRLQCALVLDGEHCVQQGEAAPQS